MVIRIAAGASALQSSSVRDNGRGAPPEAFEAPTAYGVMGMRERARHLGGAIAIHSELGHGLHLHLVLPLCVPMTEAIRVLLGDDHRIVREGLKQVLADAPEIEVGAEATNGAEVLAAVRGAAAARPALDVVLLDIAMPGRDGLDVLQELRKDWPQLPVLMLSTYPERQYAVRCIKLGAAGYLNKSADPDDMIAAVRKVAGGGRLRDAGHCRGLGQRRRAAPAPNGAGSTVAPRAPGVPAPHFGAQRERNWCAAAAGTQYGEHLPGPHPGKDRHQERRGTGPVCRTPWRGG